MHLFFEDQGITVISGSDYVHKIFGNDLVLKRIFITNIKTRIARWTGIHPTKMPMFEYYRFKNEAVAALFDSDDAFVLIEFGGAVTLRSLSCLANINCLEQLALGCKGRQREKILQAKQSLLSEICELQWFEGQHSMFGNA